MANLLKIQWLVFCICVQKLFQMPKFILCSQRSSLFFNRKRQNFVRLLRILPANFQSWQINKSSKVYQQMSNLNLKAELDKKKNWIRDMLFYILAK